MKTRANGFTIIEVAIVMSLIVLMSALVTPILFKNVARRFQVREAINAVVGLKIGMDNLYVACTGYVYAKNVSYPMMDMLKGEACMFPSNSNRNNCSVCATRYDTLILGNFFKDNGHLEPDNELNSVFTSTLAEADYGGLCGFLSSDLGGHDMGFYVTVNEDYNNPRLLPEITYCGAVRGPGTDQHTLILLNRDGSGTHNSAGNALPAPCPHGVWCQISEGGSAVRQGCCRNIGLRY